MQQILGGLESSKNPLFTLYQELVLSAIRVKRSGSSQRTSNPYTREFLLTSRLRVNLCFLALTFFLLLTPFLFINHLYFLLYLQTPDSNNLTPQSLQYFLTFPKSYFLLVHFSSVQFSRSVVSDSLQPHEPQHTRPCIIR